MRGSCVPDYARVEAVASPEWRDTVNALGPGAQRASQSGRGNRAGAIAPGQSGRGNRGKLEARLVLAALVVLAALLVLARPCAPARSDDASGPEVPHRDDLRPCWRVGDAYTAPQAMVASANRQSTPVAATTIHSTSRMCHLASANRTRLSVAWRASRGGAKFRRRRGGPVSVSGEIHLSLDTGSRRRGRVPPAWQGPAGVAGSRRRGRVRGPERGIRIRSPEPGLARRHWGISGVAETGGRFAADAQAAFRCSVNLSRRRAQQACRSQPLMANLAPTLTGPIRQALRWQRRRLTGMVLPGAAQAGPKCGAGRSRPVPGPAPGLAAERPKRWIGLQWEDVGSYSGSSWIFSCFSAA